MARVVNNFKLNVQLDASLQNLVGLANVAGPISRGLQSVLTSGISANQVDWVYSETNTLAISGTKDYDLAGVLTDIFGAVITFARVKLVMLFADAGNTNNVILGGAASNQFQGPFGAVAHTIACKPGGWLAFYAPDLTGWPVTAGTGDLLRTTNSAAGTTVLYDIVIAGCSA